MRRPGVRSSRLEGRPIATAVVYTVVGVLPLYLTSAQAVRLQEDLAFGKTELGLIVSSYFLISAIASKRVGPSLDRTGPARGFRLSALLTLVASALIGVGAQQWQTVAVLLGVAGMANAYGQVAANLVIATSVRGERQGFAFAAKQSAVPLGAMLSGFAVPWVGETASWRWPYAVVAVAAVGLVLVRPRFDLPSSPAGRPSRRRPPPALMALMLAAGIAGGIGNSTASFTADSAVTSGFAASTAALLLTLGGLTAIAARIGAGLTADRRQRTGFAESLSLFVLAVLGLVVLTFSGSSKPVFVAGLLLTFAGAWGWQGVMNVMVIRTIDIPAATATGAVASGTYLGTVAVPALVGIVAEQLSYTAVFAGQAALMVVAVLSVVAGRLLNRTPVTGSEKGQR